MTAAPFTAFCPTCDGRRTFNYSYGSDAMVCVACGGRDVIDPAPIHTLADVFAKHPHMDGMTVAAPTGAAPLAELPDERLAMPDALELLEDARRALELAARDDRETLGELAGTVVAQSEELAELRDEVHVLSGAVIALSARVGELERRLSHRDVA